MDSQLQADWAELLDQVADTLNPIHDEIFQRFPMHYYWATYQSEWATDIVFRAAEDLRRLYPLWIHHAMTTFRSPDVLRFLGKQFTAAGHINGHVKAEVTSDLKGPLMWLPMRRGIADLHRRAEVSQGVNERYLNALASTDDTTRLKELLAPLERPVIRDGKRSRALRPFDDQDRLLLEAISRGEFIINGFRNKDLHELLYAGTAQSVKESRRRSAATSRTRLSWRAAG